MDYVDYISYIGIASRQFDKKRFFVRSFCRYWRPTWNLDPLSTTTAQHDKCWHTEPEV